MLDQVVEIENAFGLIATAFADGEEMSEAAPCRAVLRIRDDIRRAVGEDETRANKKLEWGQLDTMLEGETLPHFLEIMMGAHDSRDAVAVCDADAGEPQRDCLWYQFFRGRCTAQEGKMSGNGELCISMGRIRVPQNEGLRSFLLLVGKLNDVAHANTPCRNQRVGCG